MVEIMDDDHDCESQLPPKIQPHEQVQLPNNMRNANEEQQYRTTATTTNGSCSSRKNDNITLSGYVSENGNCVTVVSSSTPTRKKNFTTTKEEEKKEQQQLQQQPKESEDDDEEVLFFDAESEASASFSSFCQMNGGIGRSDDDAPKPPPTTNTILTTSTNPTSKQDFMDSDDSVGSLITTPKDSSDPLDSSSTREKKKKDRYSKVFGENYNKKEANFVLVAAIILSLNSGFMNGVTMSGLMTDVGSHRSVGVSGLTGAWTKSGLEFGLGDWGEYGFQTSLILSYMLGSFLTGVITPCGRTYHIEPTYGPTLLLGGVLLMVSSFLAWYESNNTSQGPHYTFFFAAASNGIQNGIASIYSAKLIRCTMTGVSVDIGLTFGQMVRGNKENKWKGVVLGLVSFNFWLGGVLSIFATQNFLYHTLFLSAGLLFCVGFALVWWLVVEMDMSIYNAVFGTWKWESTLLQLQESIAAQQQEQSSSGGIDGDDTDLHKTYMDWFDMIDQDGSGTVDADELLEALKQANINMKLRDVKVLVKFADTSGDGLIDRDEWKVVIDKLFEKTSSRARLERAKTSRNLGLSNSNHSLRRSSSVFLRR